MCSLTTKQPKLAALPQQVAAPAPQDPGVMRSPEETDLGTDPSRMRRGRARLRSDSLTIPSE